MLQFVLVACCRAFTTQHDKALSAVHRAAKHVRADQSATAQASRQSWREPALRPASICSSLCCVLKSNVEIGICPAGQKYTGIPLHHTSSWISAGHVSMRTTAAVAGICDTQHSSSCFVIIVCMMHVTVRFMRVQFSPSAHTRRDFFLHKK